MLAIPAMAICQGVVAPPAAPTLNGVSYGEDPRDVLRAWAAAGFHRVHLEDVDASTGRGSNLAVVRDLLDEGFLPAQVGGGVQTTGLVNDLLAGGAGWMVVGARAIDEPDWMDEICVANPGSIILAVTVRDRRLVRRDWARTFPRDIIDCAGEIKGFPLAGLLVTAHHSDGRPPCLDLPLMEDLAEESAWPVFASGGIATMGDLRALEERGLAGAVIGTAMRSGALIPHVVAEEFAA
jgi:phosphoribosylformimino-5-aminoimidazole carboxamide ribotide isomerase